MSVWDRRPRSAADRAAFADAERGPLWRIAREPLAPLVGETTADLCIVGAGFTGLWAAIRAKKLDPAREVVVLEASRVGHAASGRNGGFCDCSLTHGLANGMARFAGEMDLIERLGRENFAGFIDDIARHGIDAELEQTGELLAILEPYQDEWLTDDAELEQRFGYDITVLDQAAMQAEVASPTYRGGIWRKDGSALVHPGKLVDGLLSTALGLGVRVYEDTPALDTSVRTPRGVVRARKTLLATNAYAPLVPAARRRIVPVYDYVLATEPLSAEQRQSLNWTRRQGMADGANHFHYYRLTQDDRIVWGGYEAVFRRSVDARHDDHERVFETLSRHFFTTFPQLEGVRFSHRWGGAIDTCGRFSAFFGSAGPDLAYVLGYTGLGVVASRWGAHVCLDLLDGRDNPARALKLVRRQPLPFPPEPLRTAVIELTRNRLTAADANDGRRGLWLRTLDRFGLGFDS